MKKKKITNELFYVHQELGLILYATKNPDFSPVDSLLMDDLRKRIEFVESRISNMLERV